MRAMLDQLMGSERDVPLSKGRTGDVVYGAQHCALSFSKPNRTQFENNNPHAFDGAYVSY